MTPAPTLQPLLLTADDVARLLAVKPGTVRNLHRFGRLPGVRVGRELRWHHADVEEYVRQLQPREG